MYAVKIVKTGRYINWFNAQWYDTTANDTPKFTYDEAKKVTEQMKNHYCYDMDIVGEDGSIENVCHLKSLRRAKAIKRAMQKQAEQPATKSLFKVNSGMLSNVKLKSKK